MNVTLLVDALVRQTTILIAQLAASGGRPSLAHVANAVFIGLAKELKQEGLSREAIADLFGLTLRAYNDKVRKLEESTTYGGRSLWGAVFDFVQARRTVTLAEVLMRFRNDDERVVRSVLEDLVESSLVFRTGRGSRTTFRMTEVEELRHIDRDTGDEAVANLVWVAVNRLGPATLEQIERLTPMRRPELERALRRLLEDGRVKVAREDDKDCYSCEGCFIPDDEPQGWEAALFQHYQALVTTLTTQLGRGLGAADPIGSATFPYVVWQGHPMREEVYGTLQRLRADAAGLFARLATYNAEHPAPAEVTRVIAYLGQTVVSDEAKDPP